MFYVLIFFTKTNFTEFFYIDNLSKKKKIKLKFNIDSLELFIL